MRYARTRRRVRSARLLGGLALVALAGPTPAAAPPARAAASADTLAWTAPLEAAVSAEVYALTTGPVREVRAHEGDPVARGDTLVVLEAADLRLAVARANLACRRTQGYLDRAGQLHARGGVSTQELETLRYEAEAAQLRLEQAELDLSRTVLCAPMDGQVAACAAQVGRPTAAGQVLLVLIDATDLQADLYLPATQLASVRLHQVVQAVPAAAPAAEPGRPMAGRVVHISPILDPHSGQARVRLLFAQAGRHHRPGTLVRVQLKGE